MKIKVAQDKLKLGQLLSKCTVKYLRKMKISSKLKQIVNQVAIEKYLNNRHFHKI